MHATYPRLYEIVGVPGCPPPSFAAALMAAQQQQQQVCVGTCVYVEVNEGKGRGRACSPVHSAAPTARQDTARRLKAF